MGFSLNWRCLLRACGFIFLLSAVIYLHGCGGGALKEFSPEGKWFIDKEATAEYAKLSPRWKPEDEKNLPRLLDMLAERYSLEIGDDSIVIEERGSRFEIPVAMEEISSRGRVYRGALDGREFFFTLEMMAGGSMSFRSSLSDDFDYVLWRREE